MGCICWRSAFTPAYRGLKPELNAGLIAEIALVLVSGSEPVAKPGKYVIDLRWAESDGVRERDIYTAANHKVECVVARVVNDASCQLFAKVSIETGMGATKQGFCEGFEVLGVELNDRPYVVCEEIGRSLRGADIVCKSHAAALVAGELGLDSDHIREEISDIRAAAVERMAAEGSAILRIKAKIGVVTCDFRFGAILRDCDRSHQQNSN
jgi:hypothetical protein